MVIRTRLHNDKVVLKYEYKFVKNKYEYKFIIFKSLLSSKLFFTFTKPKFKIPISRLIFHVVRGSSTPRDFM